MDEHARVAEADRSATRRVTDSTRALRIARRMTNPASRPPSCPSVQCIAIERPRSEDSPPDFRLSNSHSAVLVTGGTPRPAGGSAQDRARA